MGYTDKTFLDVLKPYVLQDMKDTGILASLTAAQAFIESNKGNSGLTTKANNLFGIKGEYNGQYVVMPTTEYYNGVKTKVNAKFRKYPSWKESIADHSRLFNNNKRYANLRGCTNYLEACKNVQADGYATSPTYAKTLASTVEKYRLYEWDAEVLGTAQAQPYNDNITYTTQQDLYVRDNPDGNKVKFDKLTENAKLHAKKDIFGYAILLKGTRVTCKGISATESCIWMKIPSGWLCARNSKNIYIL
ncbi:MAG: glycoside hydrolase family 73 protein [Clostridiales bacterium]|nr:glycoside hydrolase family 73 protein [Clostridiales bacterium]